MDAALELYWIPLGAGTPVVRCSGRVYERIVAARQRRPPARIYHAALVARLGAEETTIEMAPTPDRTGRTTRGVVAEGPVGLHWLGRWRLFRYELRRWPQGTIPDLAAAAAHATVTTDRARVERLLDAVPGVPTLTWGRDELGVGDMWNSNSVVAWLLGTAALLDGAVPPPHGGRAPGWLAGLSALRVPVPTGR